MPVSMQGTVPYPPMAEARPIIELATQLRELGQLFNQQSGQIRQTATTATSTWTGQAANTFVQNMTGRADTISDVGRLLGQAATPLQAFAAAITSTQAAYSAAATAERAAQAGLPWTAAALAAAIAAETGAVTAHQAAGFACAGALGGIVAQIAIKEFLGGRRTGTTPANGASTGDRGDGDGIIDTVLDWILGDDEQPTSPTAAPTDHVPGAADAASEPVDESGPLTDADYERVARGLGVEVAAIRAVAEAESPRGPFLPDGRPSILFERHYFRRLTDGAFDASNPDLSGPARRAGQYGTYTRQWDRFDEASRLNRRAAIESASWGRFQVMGENWRAAGYASADAFAADANTEQGQLRQFVGYMRGRPGALEALRDRDWAAFARAYNGPNYRQNAYDTRMREYYERFSAGSR